MGGVMEDNEKRREQLFDELKKPRSQNATLEKSMTGIISYELVTEESRRYVESIVETIQELFWSSMWTWR